ncbi:potassium/sodium hyperpolarization-activated cyclic nucleotide-gated channel 1 [Electrophorus electricus]|uniref:potassium/sodium hyperpolarization-activated cyclic nucleotide-gated channel 1 n=1 Tax=Electrophorus electricus TaxID=8005 RepID=UPI0015D0301F|nr:potassium/sodium hyperpolarization-activated cyclic nucleotide-gated channel 1 [Electrophorus electricus]
MERQAPGNTGCFSKDWCMSLLLPQLNRQSLHVYGSEVAVEIECIKQRKRGLFVIHPFSTFRSYYITCMVVVIFMNLIGIPMEISYLNGHRGVGWGGFNVFSDTLFLIDIGLNFRTGIVTEDSEAAVLDIKCIRQMYLKGWFIADVITSFPVGCIVFVVNMHYYSEYSSETSSAMASLLTFLKILSLVRLLRVSRLVRFLNEAEQVTNSDHEMARVLFRVMSVFMVIFLLCHWNGCVQYFVPMLKAFPIDCWIQRENLMNATVIEKYTVGVFRALSHMTATSYGASGLPTNEVELWIVVTSMVSGAIMYTFLVANTVTLMTEADITSWTYISKNNHLKGYMKEIKLPKDLCTRINSYFKTRYGGKWYDEKEVLNWVSSSLREEILMIMCSHLVRKVPIFRNCNEIIMSTVLLQLQYEVFQEGDVIMYPDTPCDRMFFIEHGHVILQRNSFKRELDDGDYFGEICLLTRGNNLDRVYAQSACYLFSLSVERFYQILEDYPELMKDLERAVGPKL